MHTGHARILITINLFQFLDVFVIKNNQIAYGSCPIFDFIRVILFVLTYFSWRIFTLHTGHAQFSISLQFFQLFWRIFHGDYPICIRVMPNFRFNSSCFICFDVFFMKNNRIAYGSCPNFDFITVVFDVLAYFSLRLTKLHTGHAQFSI